MQQLSGLREHVSTWRNLETRARDAAELLEMAAGEADNDLLGEIEGDIETVAADLAKLEFQVMLSGEHDKSDAILAIHAGAGGTDSQDWAEMLLRMFTRWAESQRFKVQVIDSLGGDEAGIKRAMLSIEGRYAYGYLRSERGVHRLVRLSPFDAAHRRHTSFCLVEVWPDIQGDIEVAVSPDEIEIEVFSASGPGGQHMQKNATAVRLIHKPTNIIVSCQSERSQTQNREMALKVLYARLYEREQERQREERDELKGDHVEAGWGNQIRSYVLHPYKMVKDLRTGYQVGTPEAVLDGDLDGFIEAYLRQNVSQETD